MTTAVFFVFAHPFLESAFAAGTAIALASGLVGSVVVLRGQVFAGDALSHVAFTGALAALAFGVDLRLGLYGACVAFALLLAVLGRRTGADDTVIGSVFAWVLGLGALFLSVFTTSSSGTGGTGTSGVNVLFGSILGLTGGQALTDAVVALVVVAGTVAVGRPLLFASLDPAVAAARGVPVRTLSTVFFVLLGLTAGVATQAVGALLLIGLLAAPAGAAQRLTARSVPGAVVVGGPGRRLDVGGPLHRLPRPGRATQLRHPRRRHRCLPRDVRLVGGPSPPGRPPRRREGTGRGRRRRGRHCRGGPCPVTPRPPAIGAPPTHLVVCPA